MPYFRQKTWLPLAPRIAGLSVKESPYGFGLGNIAWGTRAGMGQAPCPSAQQLAGITDCSDPCQAGYGACAAAVTNLPALPVTSSPITGSNVLDIAGTNIPLLPSTIPTDLGTWFQQNEGVILIVGVGLFALALLKGIK